MALSGRVQYLSLYVLVATLICASVGFAQAPQSAPAAPPKYPELPSEIPDWDWDSAHSKRASWKEASVERGSGECDRSAPAADTRRPTVRKDL